MKRFLTLLLAACMCFLCLGLTACDEDDEKKKTLYVYTNAGFAPYEYLTVDGDIVGVDIDIMEEIGEILGYKIVVKDIKFDQIFIEVPNNVNAVGAAGISKSDDRDAIMQASIPYATSTQYVIAPKDSLDAFVSVDGTVELSALAGKKIGVQKGTTGHSMIEKALSEKGDLYNTNTKVIEYQNAILASNDIDDGMVGVVVIDELPAKHIVAANSDLECYKINAQPESYVLYFNKNATELVEKVNRILKVMIDNKVIDYLILKHSGGIV